MRRTKRSRGFTLLEVLIAVLIVGIIATAALPLLGSYTEKAREARAEANMLVKAQAIDRYEKDHKAPLGLVYSPSTSTIAPYGLDTMQGPSAQLLLPTDANGVAMGDVAEPNAGPFIHGPYLAQLPPEPASVLLATASSNKIGPFLLYPTDYYVAFTGDPTTGSFKGTAYACTRKIEKEFPIGIYHRANGSATVTFRQQAIDWTPGQIDGLFDGTVRVDDIIGNVITALKQAIDEAETFETHPAKWDSVLDYDVCQLIGDVSSALAEIKVLTGEQEQTGNDFHCGDSPKNSEKYFRGEADVPPKAMDLIRADQQYGSQRDKFVDTSDALLTPEGQALKQLHVLFLGYEALDKQYRRVKNTNVEIADVYYVSETEAKHQTARLALNSEMQRVFKLKGLQYRSFEEARAVLLKEGGKHFPAINSLTDVMADASEMLHRAVDYPENVATVLRHHGCVDNPIGMAKLSPVEYKKLLGAGDAHILGKFAQLADSIAAERPVVLDKLVAKYRASGRDVVLEEVGTKYHKRTKEISAAEENTTGKRAIVNVMSKSLAENTTEFFADPLEAKGRRGLMVVDGRGFIGMMKRWLMWEIHRFKDGRG